MDLILTLAGGLAVALVFGFLTQALRLSPIVGYIVGGIAVGPFTPGFVANASIAEQLAELGVILLMFGVGETSSKEPVSSARGISCSRPLALLRRRGRRRLR